jgi:dual specificity phosphatase 12
LHSLSGEERREERRERERERSTPLTFSMEEKEEVQVTKAVDYLCRMCRRVLFSSEDLEAHQHGQQALSRRQLRGGQGSVGDGQCSSLFLKDAPAWLPEGNSEAEGEVEGKLRCPGPRCGARIGTFKWTGSQCSCGTWVTPAFQIPRSKLDERPVAGS